MNSKKKAQSEESFQGKGEGFTWEIVLGYRQNYGSNLEEREGYIKEENGFASIWISEKDYLEWSKKQKANNAYLGRELPKAKQERDQAILTAKKAGASEHQISLDFATRYDSRVLQGLPFKEVFDTRVAKIATNTELFCKIAEQEAERIILEKKVALESLFPLLEPSKILRGYQPALKIAWTWRRQGPETVREPQTKESSPLR